MRGGRTEPRMVSRTTYNAHAAARHQISSYPNFVAAQQAVTGIPPSQNIHPAAEASGTTHRRHSRSPSPNNRNKRFRGSQVLDVADSDKSEDGAEMEEEVVVKHEDVEAGFQIPLFGSDRGTQSPQNIDEHRCVCSTTMITLIP